MFAFERKLRGSASHPAAAPAKFQRPTCGRSSFTTPGRGFDFSHISIDAPAADEMKAQRGAHAAPSEQQVEVEPKRGPGGPGPATASRGKGSAPIRTTSATVQGTATWDAAGTVHEINNLASVTLNNKAAGETAPRLNGDASSLATPTLSVARSSGGEFDASVDEVPKNVGSFDETVLTKGPWTTTVPKATISQVLGLPGCESGGNSTFRVVGKPSDAAIYQANRRHEDHHVADFKIAFENTIAKWTAKLTDAQRDKTTFHGKTQDLAVDALYLAVGGKPSDVATAFTTAGHEASDAYHNTAKGKEIAVKDARGNTDCSVCSADAYNPA